MAEQFTFTQAAVGKLPLPGKGRVYYRDGKMPGLVVCVSTTGCKTFQVVRWMDGRAARLKIGRFPQVTVEAARKIAQSMAGDLARGQNPADQRREARAETLFGNLFSIYLEHHSKVHKRTWQEDQNRYNQFLKPWAARKLSSIRRGDVAALHARVGRNNGPYAANRLLALISTLFSYAGGMGFDGPNPCHKVKRFEEIERERFMDGAEIKRFFAALQNEQTPQLWRDFFELALLTGARRMNLMTMRWEDLNLERGVWCIPAEQFKNKKPMTVVLPATAVTILERRKVENEALQEEKRRPWVFPGRRHGNHITDATKPWRQLLKLAKIDGLRLHDLRRTLASWMVAGGVSLPIIGKTLGHRDQSTTAIYARLNLDPVRVAVEGATAAILHAGGQVEQALPELVDVGPDDDADQGEK